MHEAVCVRRDDDHHRPLRSLRLVERDRPCTLKMLAFVRLDCYRAPLIRLDLHVTLRRDLHHHRLITVEELEFVVVLRPDDLIANHRLGRHVLRCLRRRRIVEQTLPQPLKKGFIKDVKT